MVLVSKRSSITPPAYIISPSAIRDSTNAEGLFTAHKLNLTQLHFGTRQCSQRTNSLSTDRPSFAAANQVVTLNASCKWVDWVQLSWCAVNKRLSEVAVVTPLTVGVLLSHPGHQRRRRSQVQHLTHNIPTPSLTALRCHCISSPVVVGRLRARYTHNTKRYDTRCYFKVHSKLTPHRTKN